MKLTSPFNPLANDLDYVLNHTKPLWKELQGKRIFITGGTGFFGCWLLESLLWANEKLGLDATALVLTRNPESFMAKSPHLGACSAINFHKGDIRDFSFPKGTFSHVIHAAATSATATFHNEDPLVKFDTVVQGTRNTLEFARQCGARKFLYTSSGAVYGQQPDTVSHTTEEYCGGPCSADISSAWGESKRAAEFLCAYYGNRYGMETKIARCFSFIGPFLPLNIHYAAGNFIRDGLSGGPITVNSDGTARRSYLYAADLAIWLWTILFNGESGGVYNVGSEEEFSISELAHIVARCFSPQMEVTITSEAKTDSTINRYIPSTRKAQQYLGLTQTVGLEEALAKTIGYYHNIIL